MAPAVGGSVARRPSPFQDSPSVVRARARSAAVEDDSTGAIAADFGDDDLEARAASLLRGRFGSVSRSLNASRSSTPTRAPSSPSLLRIDPEPSSRLEPTSAPRRSVPPPPPLQQQRQSDSDTRPLQIQQITPPRPTRHTQPQAPSSSPPFEPTLMQESLSNFTPLAWEKTHGPRMAFFQRLAGMPKDEILRGQQADMAEEVAKAHARMQPRSPGSPCKRGARRQLQSVSPSKKNRTKQVAAITSSPTKERVKRPEAVLRSPRTNRRIYALETQLGDGLGQQRATSLQPLHGGVGTDAVDQRRTMSEARYAAAAVTGASTVRQAMENGGAPRPVEEEEEDESETLPLPWPAEDDQGEAPARIEDRADETQPLPWHDPEDEPQVGRASQQDDRSAELLEVPPSDDEDLLLQNVISSSSSSPSSSPSPSPSRSRRTRGATPPPAKRQRIKQEQHDASPLTNRLMRTPLQPPPQPGLPRVSLVSLTPSTPGGGSSRFDRVVAALKREERRQHKGAQLNLDTFVSSSGGKPRVEGSREGLSEDLTDVLSDDEGGDITVTAGQDEEADETQPLPWSSPHRNPPSAPLSSPTGPPTQRSTTSNTSPRTNSSRGSSSSAVSLPSEGYLDEAGNTQLRSFFHGL